MSFHKLLILLCILVFNQTITKAQGNLEAGVFLGASNYLGDLAEQVSMNETKPAYGVYLRWNPYKHLGIKALIIRGSISGRDANSPVLQKRKFAFKSDLFSSSIQLEYYPLAKRRYINPIEFKPGFQVYLLTGGGFTLANAELDYSESPGRFFTIPFPEPDDINFFFTIPFGAGFRFDLWERWSFSMDLTSWYIFSDYLDGVSINGRADRNDWYVTGGLSISHHFGGRTICADFR